MIVPIFSEESTRAQLSDEVLSSPYVQSHILSATHWSFRALITFMTTSCMLSFVSRLRVNIKVVFPSASANDVRLKSCWVSVVGLTVDVVM